MEDGSRPRDRRVAAVLAVVKCTSDEDQIKACELLKCDWCPLKYLTFVLQNIFQ